MINIKIINRWIMRMIKKLVLNNIKDFQNQILQNIKIWRVNKNDYYKNNNKNYKNQ